MTAQEFQEIMMRLLRVGVTIEMFLKKDSQGNEQLWFDLNTGMKSHLHIHYSQNVQGMMYEARYNEKGVIESWEDLIDTARHCMHGRTFASSNWFTVLAGEA